jgi:uncharacterized small protein (DUF1192 family)
MSDTATAAPPALTANEVTTLKQVAANYAAALAGEHVDVPIPASDVRPPASVWAAGDVHHTHTQVWDESPAGVQAANAPDPRDLEILRLNAIIAGTSNDPNYVGVDPRDAEIARLQAQIAASTSTSAAPVEVAATTIDPRDAEIAALQAELAAKDAAEAPASDVMAASPASSAVAGDIAPA